MYQHCLIAVFLSICIFGCNSPAPEETAQDPNVTPEGVRITPDVVYGHKFGMALTFDMYQPKNQNGAGVIWIVSGGWRAQFPDLYEYMAEGVRLATQNDLEQMTPNLSGYSIGSLLVKGFTVFAVRHGSAPKFEMPEIVSDLRRAVRFIRFNAEEYGVDSERLGLWGGSAGGHLALLLATTSNIGNSEVTEEFEKGTGRVAAVVAYYPPTDLNRLVVLFESKPNPSPKPEVLDMTEEQAREFSPLYFVSSDDPPTLILHGDKDDRVPIIESESMYQALQETGVESKFVKIHGANHGFEGKDSDLALSELVSWFEKYLVQK